MKNCFFQHPARAIITLLKAGADAKAKDDGGHTAFDYAQNYGLRVTGKDAYQMLQEASQ